MGRRATHFHNGFFLPPGAVLSAVWLLPVLFLLLFPPLANASSEKLVRVGLYQNKPALFHNGAGAKGFYADIIEAVAGLEGWKIKYVPDSLEGCLQRLKRGEIDLLPAVAYSLERDTFVDFSHEVVWSLWGVVVLPRHSSISGIEDLDGKRVAIVNREITGSNFIELTQTFGIKSLIQSYSSYADVLKAVADGRADAGITHNLYSTQHSAKHRLKSSSIVFSPINASFAVPEGRNHDVIEIFDRYMSQWKSDPESIYFKSINRWQKGRAANDLAIPLWIYVILVAVSAALLLLTFWTRSLRRMVQVRTEALEKSEKRLRELFERSPIGLFLCELDGRFVTVNPAFAKIVGRDLDAVSTQRFWDSVPEKNLEQEMRRFKTLAQSGADEPFDTELYHVDGHLVPVHMHSMIVTHDGRQLIWSSVENYSRLKQVEADREVLSEQLRQKQKMEAIGTLAGGVAHDFNNILSAIFGYTEQAMQEPSCSDGIQEKLKSVLSAASRARNLVQQILTYSRKGKDSRQPTEIYSAVLDSCNLLKSTFPGNVGFNLDVDAATGVILADPNQIQQVVVNLCTNALHALEGRGGAINVSLNSVTAGPDYADGFKNLVPGDYASLRISDSGQGISSEIAGRIFDPFFTTKGQGKGTGLGLSVVQGIIESHQGYINVESVVGEGTTFEVLFPLVSDRVETEFMEVGGAQNAEDLRGSEHVLFVDDEAMLVDIGRGTLSSFGYKVTGCSSAETALGFFRADPYRYDLLVTDQVMPDMTGDILVEEVLKIRPDMPIIICTGHSSILDEKRLEELGVKKLLMKPLSSRFLLNAVRQVLDAGKSVIDKLELWDQKLGLKTQQAESGGETAVESLRQEFRQLPEAVRDSLQAALKGLSPDRIDSAIEEIAGLDQDIAQVLSVWARDFRYDLLKELYKG